MATATWNDVIVAESDKTEIVDGNHYFPPDSLMQEYFRKSDATTICGWREQLVTTTLWCKTKSINRQRGITPNPNNGEQHQRLCRLLEGRESQGLTPTMSIKFPT